MKKILAIPLSALTLLSSGLLFVCSAEKIQPDADAVWKMVSEAYIYALPLVLTNATKTLSTNTDGTMESRAPVNQFNHAEKLGQRVNADIAQHELSAQKPHLEIRHVAQAGQKQGLPHIGQNKTDLGLGRGQLADIDLAAHLHQRQQAAVDFASGAVHGHILAV